MGMRYHLYRGMNIYNIVTILNITIECRTLVSTDITILLRIGRESGKKSLQGLNSRG